jgi:hypothetical protein
MSNKPSVEMAHFRITIAHGTYHRKMRCLSFAEENTQFRLTFAPSKLAKPFIVPEHICRTTLDGLVWSPISANNKEALDFDTNPPFFVFNLEMSERAFGFETLRRNASEDSLCSISMSTSGHSTLSSGSSSSQSRSPTPIPTKVVLPRPSIAPEQQSNLGDNWIPMAIIRTPPLMSGRRGDSPIVTWSFVRTSLTDADLQDIDIDNDSPYPLSGRYGVWTVQRLLLASNKTAAAPLPERKTYGDSVGVLWTSESRKDSLSSQKMLDIDIHADQVEFLNRVGEFRTTKDKMTVVATIETEYHDGRMRVKITRVDLFVARDSPVVGVFVLSNNMLEQERMAANKLMTPRGFTVGMTSTGPCCNKSCQGKLRCSHVRDNDNAVATRERRHSLDEGQYKK